MQYPYCQFIFKETLGQIASRFSLVWGVYDAKLQRQGSGKLWGRKKSFIEDLQSSRISSVQQTDIVSKEHPVQVQGRVKY